MENNIIESKRIIQNASKNNKLVIFVGAGVSANSGIPMWGNIIDKIKKKIDIEEKDFLKIAQYFYNSRGQKEYYDFLESELNIDVKPNLLHDKILELNPYHIITTNYDDLIEQQANEKGMFFDIVSKDNDLPYTPNNKMIIKMHGDFKNKNIVFKEDDYLSYHNNFKLIENYIKSIFSTHIVLFIGYSLSDPDVQYIFQWVKDILKSDLARPYFLKINKDNKINMIEYEYYKNKGINILYYSQLGEEVIKEVEKDSDEIESDIGKKVYGFLRFLLDDYKREFNIENFLNAIDEYKNILYIKKDDVTKFICDKTGFKYYEDFEIHNNILYFFNKNAQEFIKNIENKVRRKEYDFNVMINFLDRAEIRCVIEYKDEDRRNKKILFRRKGEYQFIKNKSNIEKFNFTVLNKYVDQYDTKENYNYKNELEKAYVNCYLKKYFEAYKIYKKLSKNALKNQEFVIFAISEFNRYYVGKIIAGDIFEIKENREFVKNEITKIELDKIPLKFPFNMPEQTFIKLILNWQFDNSKMSNIRKQVNKDEQSFFLVSNDESIGINKAKEFVTNLDKFIKYNYLAINNYNEVRRIFYDYIDLIMKDYVVPKIFLEENESFFGERLENIKLEQFELVDIRFIIEYLSKQEIENILNRYEIRYISLCDNEIELYIEMMKNIIEYLTIHIERHVSNEIDKVLLILSTIKLKSNQIDDIIEKLIIYIKKNGKSINDYKYFNKFIYNQYEDLDKDNEGQLMNLLLVVLEQIIIDKNICVNQNVFLKNLVFYINKISNKSKIDNTEIINKLIENNECILLTEISKILKNSDRNKVRKIVNKILKEEKYSDLHCNIYYESLMQNIIRPKEDYEIKFYNYIKELKDKISDEETKGLRTYPSSKDKLEGKLICINNLKFNNYLINNKLFEEFLGIFDNYDFLFDINSFEVSKFKLDWVNKCGDKLLITISENEEIKKEIQRQIKNNILNDKKIDKDTLTKCFKYFY